MAVNVLILKIKILLDLLKKDCRKRIFDTTPDQGTLYIYTRYLLLE